MTDFNRLNTYPVVDLFAGAGGFSEGFSSVLDASGNRRFGDVLSIEKEDNPHRTLLFRHFFNYFPPGEAPDDYYDFLALRISETDLIDRRRKAWEHAERHVLKISLGPETRQRVRREVAGFLNGRKKWVLIGGPPCQVYSIAGRSSMAGRSDFDSDERHTLYMEYRKVIADHQPPVFVMENVKGLLSASIENNPAALRIMRDLSRPSDHLVYQLHSFSHGKIPEGEKNPKLFLVRAEEHGIPQSRHRVFIAGIRSDIVTKMRPLKKYASATVHETIGNLPPVRSRLSSMPDSSDAWMSEIQKVFCMCSGLPENAAEKLRESSLLPFEHVGLHNEKISDHEILRNLRDSRVNILCMHQARSHMASDLRRYFYSAFFAKKLEKVRYWLIFPMSFFQITKT